MSLTDAQPLSYTGIKSASDTQSTRYRIAVAALTIAAIADLATTQIGLSVGLVEGNPLPAAVLNTTGILGFLLIKVAAASLLLGPLTISTNERTRQVALAGCLLIAAIWSIAAGWNTTLILAQGGL